MATKATTNSSSTFNSFFFQSNQQNQQNMNVKRMNNEQDSSAFSDLHYKMAKKIAQLTKVRDSDGFSSNSYNRAIDLARSLNRLKTLSTLNALVPERAPFCWQNNQFWNLGYLCVELQKRRIREYDSVFETAIWTRKGANTAWGQQEAQRIQKQAYCKRWPGRTARKVLERSRHRKVNFHKNWFDESKIKKKYFIKGKGYRRI